MGQQWYVIVGEDEQRGPISEEDIRTLASAGQVDGDTLCWREGFAEWVPLAQEGLFAEQAQQVAHSPAPTVSDRRETWSNIKSSFGKGKQGAVRKMKIAKLKLQISQIRKKREKHCAALGFAAYEKREELALDTSLGDEISAVAQCDEEIAGVEREIAEIEAEEA